jgi:hypothetical protein
MVETMCCYRHPKRETRVSCATCGRPICTECMRQTEVGIKCPDDARLPRGARAGVMKGSQMVRSLLAGVAVALLGVPVVLAIFRGPVRDDHLGRRGRRRIRAFPHRLLRLRQFFSGAPRVSRGGLRCLQ